MKYTDVHRGKTLGRGLTPPFILVLYIFGDWYA